MEILTEDLGMIDLSLYVGKKVTITLRNGEIWKGVMVSYDEEGEYPYVVGDDLGEDFFYQNGQRYSYPSEYDIMSVISHETNLCNEIPMPEPDMTPEKIDLSQFVDKKVTATFRSGEVINDILRVSRSSIFPYSLMYSTYTRSGGYYTNGEHVRDIISIKLCEEPEMAPSIDLSQFVGKRIQVKLRGGQTMVSKVEYSKNEAYPFTIFGFSYLVDGRRNADWTTPFDIMSIIAVTDVTETNKPGVVYIARYNGNILCAFPNREEVKDYLREKHADVDPYEVSITAETLK